MTHEEILHLLRKISGSSPPTGDEPEKWDDVAGDA